MKVEIDNNIHEIRFNRILGAAVMHYGYGIIVDWAIDRVLFVVKKGKRHNDT